ncbi:hypothetical protein [Candidatus Poriferisodalis sp.]|uniref:hypothetical protein n=1 Tax=Candidatus Poriferisodalis sp. TaxID=3101277 RepID=UPI003D09C340
MAVDYNGVFEAVIQGPWLDIPEAQRNAASSDRHGQLPSDAPDAYALHDCFNYQRGHADVFREVYKKSRHVPPRKGERLRVIDIGAGAATVAIALGEALGRKKLQTPRLLGLRPKSHDAKPWRASIGSP